MIHKQGYLRTVLFNDELGGQHSCQALRGTEISRHVLMRIGDVIFDSACAHPSLRSQGARLDISIEIRMIAIIGTTNNTSNVQVQIWIPSSAGFFCLRSFVFEVQLRLNNVQSRKLLCDMHVASHPHHVMGRREPWNEMLTPPTTPSSVFSDTAISLIQWFSHRLCPHMRNKAMHVEWCASKYQNRSNDTATVVMRGMLEAYPLRTTIGLANSGMNPDDYGIKKTVAKSSAGATATMVYGALRLNDLVDNNGDLFTSAFGYVSEEEVVFGNERTDFPLGVEGNKELVWSVTEPEMIDVPSSYPKTDDGVISVYDRGKAERFGGDNENNTTAAADLPSNGSVDDEVPSSLHTSKNWQPFIIKRHVGNDTRQAHSLTTTAAVLWTRDDARKVLSATHTGSRPQDIAKAQDLWGDELNDDLHEARTNDGDGVEESLTINDNERNATMGIGSTRANSIRPRPCKRYTCTNGIPYVHEKNSWGQLVTIIFWIKHMSEITMMTGDRRTGDAGNEYIVLHAVPTLKENEKGVWGASLCTIVGTANDYVNDEGYDYCTDVIDRVTSQPRDYRPIIDLTSVIVMVDRMDRRKEAMVCFIHPHLHKRSICANGNQYFREKESWNYLVTTTFGAEHALEITLATCIQGSDDNGYEHTAPYTASTSIESETTTWSLFSCIRPRQGRSHDVGA